MIIEYDVDCFERTLVIKCPNSYAEHIIDIKHILNDAYLAWHSPENIEDPEEREWAEDDACCEEYMISKVNEVYPIGERDWNTFYYGDDENEIEEDMEGHQHDYQYNMKQLDNAIDHLEDRSYGFEPFERFGNEAYWIVADCIKKLKELKMKAIEEVPFTRYKCKHCGFAHWDIDNDVEEELWGHIQMNHEDIFEEVQNWETPDMIEECYEEGI